MIGWVPCSESLYHMSIHMHTMSFYTFQQDAFFCGEEHVENNVKEIARDFRQIYGSANPRARCSTSLHHLSRRQARSNSHPRTPIPLIQLYFDIAHHKDRQDAFL